MPEKFSLGRARARNVLIAIGGFLRAQGTPTVAKWIAESRADRRRRRRAAQGVALDSVAEGLHSYVRVVNGLYSRLSKDVTSTADGGLCKRIT